MKSELFRDDLALDVRDNCIEKHVTEFEQNIYSEHSDRSDLRWLMAHLEIIFAVTSYCGQNALTSEQVAKWERRALELFDADERKSDVTSEWRRKICEAFARLSAAIQNEKGA